MFLGREVDEPFVAAARRARLAGLFHHQAARRGGGEVVVEALRPVGEVLRPFESAVEERLPRRRRVVVLLDKLDLQRPFCSSAMVSSGSTGAPR
jgi:hypothetical protein